MEPKLSLIPGEKLHFMVSLRWLGIYTQNEIEYDKALQNDFWVYASHFNSGRYQLKQANSS